MYMQLGKIWGKKDKFILWMDICICNWERWEKNYIDLFCGWIYVYADGKYMGKKR